MPFVPMRPRALLQPASLQTLTYGGTDITKVMVEQAVWQFARGLLMVHGNTHPIYAGNIVQDPWTDAWFAWHESERILDELLEDDE